VLSGREILAEKRGQYAKHQQPVAVSLIRSKYSVSSLVFYLQLPPQDARNGYIYYNISCLLVLWCCPLGWNLDSFQFCVCS
jgi:hypothetical protein